MNDDEFEMNRLNVFVYSFNLFKKKRLNFLIFDRSFFLRFQNICFFCKIWWINWKYMNARFLIVIFFFQNQFDLICLFQHNCCEFFEFRYRNLFFFLCFRFVYLNKIIWFLYRKKIVRRSKRLITTKLNVEKRFKLT